MALPAHLVDEVMTLPEGERLELVDYILARSGQGSEEAIGDREGLLASLGRSEQDVAAGRTRPAHELIETLRAGLR